MNKQIYDYVLVLIACIILCRSGSDASPSRSQTALCPPPEVPLPLSALPVTDGATRMMYHYIALGPRGVQDRMYYRNIDDTEAEHLPEDIVAHLRERERTQRWQ